MKILFFLYTTFLIIAQTCYGQQQNTIVVDIDGNLYHTVKIGKQKWMVENLSVTRYRNGDTIPNIKNDTAWENLTTGAYCDYNNDPFNGKTYGKLYNLYVVLESRNICPLGWHVPADEEWAQLMDYLGGEFYAGAKMKEKDTVHWKNPNYGATNEVGFSALPGGYRGYYGQFDRIGYNAYWWSSTLDGINYAWSWTILNNYFYLHRDYSLANAGFSVRCIKDK